MHDEIMVTVMETRDPIGGHSQMDSDDDEDCPSSPGSTSFDDGGLMAAAMGHDITAQLAAAGTVGMAAAAAIVSSKKKKRPHSFETNPSIRKRQQNRLLRKLRATIDEFATRVGQQAVVLVATPGKPHASFRCFGAKPLEDVMKSLRVSILDELEHALHRQAPPPSRDDPSLYELPPLVIDGIPTPVEKMTQAQLRAFIPLMLKYSTGRGKPGWGRESTKPLWWPKEIPWANVRMDARSEDEKQKCRNAQISWTHALRQIVINCYKFHGREDLLPAFNEEDEQAQLNGMTDETSNSVQNEQTVQQVASVGVLKYHQAGKGVSALSPTGYGTATVLQTINNPDGSVSLIQVDPNNPIITLPDGTTAQVQGVASALGDVTSDGVVDLNNVTEATLINHDGQLILTGEDGHEYAVKLCSVNEKLWQQGSTIETYPVVSGMISVPVSASMYQTMVQNDCTMQVVTVPKVEAGTSGGEVETISIPSGMVGTPIMMTGSEPQVLQVFSLKDGTVLTKTITSVADIKSEEPEWLNTTKVYNREVISRALDKRPKNIPLITVSNHHSCFDDPGLWASLEWRHLLNRRKMRWSLAAHDICFTNTLHSYFFMLGKCVPVIRGSGVYQDAINFCIEKLNEGEWVHVFPEGRVNMTKEFIRLKWGVGRMVYESPNVPLIIPMWHEGTDTVLPNEPPYYLRVGKKVTLVYGEPLDLSTLVKELKQKNASEIEARKAITDAIQSELMKLKEQTEKMHSRS